MRPTQPLQPSQQQLLSVEDKELATVRRSRPRRGLHCTNSILSNSKEELAGAMPNAAKVATVGPSLSHEHPCTRGRCGSCGHSLVWTASHLVGAFCKFGSFLCLCGIQSILW